MPDRYETGVRLLKELVLRIQQDSRMTRRAIIEQVEEIIAFLERRDSKP